MAGQENHSGVDRQQALKHLSIDPGLPMQNPIPSLWQQPPAEIIWEQPSREFAGETDVVIIGSGITGCSVAKNLLEQSGSVKVTILEARTLTSGATGRNGGHIMVIPELFYAGTVTKFGKEAATEFVKFTIENQDALLHLAQTLPAWLQGYSELRQLEVLHIFSSEVAKANAQALVHLLDTEYEEIQRKCKLLSKEEMLQRYGIQNSFGGANMLAGAVSPYRLITGILSNLWREYSDRFTIETKTPAESITWSNEAQQYTIQTPKGSLSAKHVVHATNAHAGHLLPSVRGFLHSLRCQVSVQEKAAGFENQGASNTYVVTGPRSLNSIYQSPRTGDFYVSGLVGISDFFEEFSPREDTNNDAVIGPMSTVLNKAFGTTVQGRVKANWAGLMAYTADGAPLVGRLAEDVSGRFGTGEYIAAGYNGVGMVNAWLCGEHISDLVLQKVEPRKIPRIFGVSKARIDQASIEDILLRPYGTWE